MNKTTESPGCFKEIGVRFGRLQSNELVVVVMREIKKFKADNGRSTKIK
jgi:hypothetical protein